MKHLKHFNESLSDREIGNLAKQDLDDVLIHLKDDGYRTNVEVVMDYHAEIFVNILDYQNQKVSIWGDIKDDIERCIEIVKDRFKPGSVYYKEIKDGKVHNRDYRDIKRWEDFSIQTKDDTKLIFFTLTFSQILPDGRSNSFY